MSFTFQPPIQPDPFHSHPRPQDLTLARFADQVTATQEAYKAAKAAKDNLAVQKALFSVHETQALWLVERDTLWRVDYQHLFKEPEEVLENLNFSMDPTMHSFSGPNDQTVFAQATKAPLRANAAMTTNPAYWGVVYSAGAQTYVRPGTFETRKYVEGGVVVLEGLGGGGFKIRKWRGNPSLSEVREQCMCHVFPCHPDALGLILGAGVLHAAKWPAVLNSSLSALCTPISRPHKPRETP